MSKYTVVLIALFLTHAAWAQVKPAGQNGIMSGPANTPTWVSATVCNMGGFSINGKGAAHQLCWLSGRDATGSLPKASGISFAGSTFQSTAGATGCTTTGANTAFPRTNCP